MKRKFNYFGLISLTFLLISCSLDPFQENISFLNENGAAFYYYGNDSDVFNKIEKYKQYSTPVLPESFPLFSAFAIDVSAMSNVLDVDFLNNLFSLFNNDKYVCVMLTNLNENCSFLAESYFTSVWPGYDQDTNGDLIVFYNNGLRKNVRFTTYFFTYSSESSYTTTNYQKSIVQTYWYDFVRDALLDQ